MQGTFFCARLNASRPTTIKELGVLLHHFLMIVQMWHPDLIPASTDVAKSYSACWSLHHDSTSQARSKKVLEDIINLNNRWRKEERAGLHKATLTMMEHYTDVVVAVEALLQYSVAL